MKENLTEKINRVIGASGRIEPGTVTHISVEHEEGCPAIKTQRMEDCTCNPTIRRMGTC